MNPDITSEHKARLSRLEQAIKFLSCDERTEVVVRKIDAALSDSVFWGTDNDGNRYIEWGAPGDPRARLAILIRAGTA